MRLVEHPMIRTSTFELSPRVKWACAQARIKEADLSAGEDMPFEQAFSNLAHAYLADRAPTLLDYEAGFQLLDRNDEGDRAVGVLGFKAGSQWLYGPVFFVNGDLKGHELLFVKNQNCFVPLQEDWVSYLINKRPMALGAGVEPDLLSLGAGKPEYSRFSQAPGKYAAALERPSRPTPADRLKFAQDAPRWYAAQMLLNPFTHESYANLPDVPTVLERQGMKAAEVLYRYVETYPRIGRALDEFYGDRLYEALDRVKQAHEARRQKAASILTPTRAPRRLPRPSDDPIKAGTLGKIVYDIHGKGPAEDDQTRLALPGDGIAEKLMREGDLIKDERPVEQTARVTTLESTRQLESPQSSGLYDVLTGPGEFKKCAVIVGPHGPHGRSDAALVIEAESPHRWVHVHPSMIWTSQQYPSSEWQAWAKSGTAAGGSLPEGSDYPAEDNRLVALVDPDRPDGTLPLSVHDSYADGRFKIRGAHFVSEIFGRPTDGLIPRDAYRSACYGPGSESPRLAVGPAGVKMRSDGTTLWIPEQFRAIKLAESNMFSGHSQDALLLPTGAVDLDITMARKMAAAPAEILEISVRGGVLKVAGVTMEPGEAIEHLVFRRGMRAETAAECLGHAHAQGLRGKVAEFAVVEPDWVKRAFGDPSMRHDGLLVPPMPAYQPQSDPMMGTEYPTYLTQELREMIPALMTDHGVADRHRPNAPVRPDPSVANAVQQAAQGGQREIFETSMLGAMLKETGDDHLVDGDLADLTKGMDRCGRILFKLYAHTKKFEERYGKDSLPELEDSLRDNFRGVGDLILFLRKKTIESNPRQSLQETKLDRD